MAFFDAAGVAGRVTGDASLAVTFAASKRGVVRRRKGCQNEVCFEARGGTLSRVDRGGRRGRQRMDRGAARVLAADVSFAQRVGWIGGGGAEEIRPHLRRDGNEPTG